MILKINGEPAELVYCPIHNEWYQVGNEMNCCARELEHFAQVEAKYKEKVGVK